MPYGGNRTQPQAYNSNQLDRGKGGAGGYSGIHKGGLSKGGFSNLCVIIVLLLLNPLY